MGLNKRFYGMSKAGLTRLAQQQADRQQAILDRLDNPKPKKPKKAKNG